MGIIAWSIPVFVLAMVAEWLWSRHRNKEIYRFTDAVTDLNCGVGSQALSLPLFVLTVGFYDLVYTNYAQLSWSTNDWPLWVLAIVGLDFLYYCWHRTSHESNLFWAAHVVHHQSEDYNLAVALRQAYFTSLTSTLFYLPLAVLGVPTKVYLIANAVSLLYQFWIHTELIDRCPRWFEWLLNTPSHHRVHHAINPQYLDRNYAAIFMLWDRAFGTFEPEQERPVYGITKPLDSFNPFWANTHRLVEMGSDAWASLRAGHMWDACWIWFAHPGWEPRTRRTQTSSSAAGSSGESEAIARYDNGLSGRPKYQVPASTPRCIYVGVAMVLNIPLTMGLLIFVKQLDPPSYLAAIGALLLAGPSFGALFEQRWWGVGLEAVRVCALVYAVVPMLALLR